MLLALLLGLVSSPARTAVDAQPLKTFVSKAYGFTLDYPAAFSVKEKRGKKNGSLWRVSFYAGANEAEPSFWVEARSLDSLAVLVKPLGTYVYEPKKNEWRLEPGYDDESTSRLIVSDLTPAKVPAYVSLTSMANYYRDDTVLTDKGYALVLHYSDADGRSDARDVNDRIAGSFRLVGTKAIKARIVDPPPPPDD